MKGKEKVQKGERGVKRKNILLINPLIRENYYHNMFPIGLGYIASTLLKGSYDVKVLDINGHRYNKERVKGLLQTYLKEYSIVGIGCLITSYDYVNWLIKTIKEINPSTKVIIGGGTSTAIPAMCINKLKADVAVLGEGEIIILNLLKILQNNGDLSKVRGIAFKNKKRIIITPPQERIKNLDELPFPAWHLFPIEVYLKNRFNSEDLMYIKENAMNVVAGRGCPFHCTFCYDVFNNIPIKRSPKNLIEELKLLKQRYNVKLVYFVDDLFIIDRDWVLEFCKIMKKENLEIKWLCCGRLNLVDERLLREMKSAGCILVSYGMESGSQKMLDVMNKQITTEQASKAIALTRKLGFLINLSFMMGFPEETKETLDETINFCVNNNIHLTSIFFVTPYPRTLIYEQARERGLIKNEEEYVKKIGHETDLTINLTKWSDDKLRGLRDYVVSTVHKAYFKKHKLEYIQWMHKKFIWYFNYIESRGLHAFLNEAKKKVINKI